MRHARLAASTAVSALAALLIGIESEASSPHEFAVSTPAELQAALRAAGAGDTIRLADRDWPAVQISGRRYSAPVVITGPARLRGRVTVAASSRLTFKRVTVDGGQLFLAADASEIVVSSSEFTRCAGICVQMGLSGGTFTTGVTISGNRFHDSSDHFIGPVGNRIRIAGNRFDRAKRPGCSAKKCPEHVRIRGGGPWTIVGNWFGEAEIQGPQVRVWPGFRPAIHDVLIASNLFYSPDVRDSAGVGIEGSAEGRDEGRPTNVRVVNNTIFVDTNSVGLGSSWERPVPGKPSPLVANNIFRATGERQCRRGRFVSNLAIRVRGTCAGVQLGQPMLDGNLAPTRASLLVIDRADPGFAPATDYRGRRRAGPPDLGAIEYRG